MKRIAMISEHASPLETGGGIDTGGQNIYVRLLSTQLAAQGYAVDVFTRRDSEDQPEVVLWKDRIRVVNVPAGPPSYVRKEEMLPYMDEFAAYMRTFIRDQPEPYDVIHANFWMSGLVAAELKRTEDIPFVITFHALGLVRRMHLGSSDQFPVERLAAEDRIVREADAIVAECPQDRDDLVNLYRADCAKVTIVPCGIDPGLMWPAGKDAARIVLGLPKDERLVLYAGRMVPRKGADNVVRALARTVKTHGVPARLLVVGGDATDPDERVREEYERLMQVAGDEGVADRVTFVAHQAYENMKFYYSAADVFVTTPWYEPFGMTPLEAMACGTPVIGSDIGGVKFTVVDGETGYLVPPKDPDVLAQRLAHLLQHPDLLETFSRNAIERTARYFTWEKVACGILDVYQQAINHRNPAPESEPAELGMVDRAFGELVQTLQESNRALRREMMQAYAEINACLDRGGKLLIAGNGGSAAQAQHMACELVGKFRAPNRPGLPAIALSADTAVVTAWANDAGYDDVFARQVAALGQPRDLLIGLSTSGKSPNLIRAFQMAKQRGLRCIALLGRGGGDVAKLAHVALVVPSDDAPHTQEVHMLLIHTLCDMIEQRKPAMELPAIPALSSSAAAAAPAAATALKPVALVDAKSEAVKVPMEPFGHDGRRSVVATRRGRGLVPQKHG